MRYDQPELRERLAAEYVLGTMPSRARRRFVRLLATDPVLAQIVGEWADRLSPLDETARPEEPPARVWRAIEARIADPAVAPGAPALPWFHSLTFWRGLAFAATAATAALAFYIALSPSRAPTPTVVAVLAGRGGEAGWVAVTGPKPGQVSFSAVAPPVEAQPRAFELWGLAGGPPRALALLPQRAGHAVVLGAAQLPALGGVLAVSIEPPGGSPTGAPTGPVLYQGKVLTRPF